MLDGIDPERLRLAVFLGGLLSFGLVETLWPARRWDLSRPRRWAAHASLALFNTLLLRLTVATPLVAWAVWVRAKGWGLAPALGLSGWVEVAASVVALDLIDYWWHRFNHEWPFLWRFHRVHHADTHVDVTTALRFHFGELLLSAGAKALWILAWGPSVWGFALFEAGISLYAQFHHANFELPGRVERVARWVHLTPRLHASHHTVSLRTRDANFATIFSVWDRLFGSFQEPDDAELRRLGLETGREDCLSPKALTLSAFQ